MGVTPLCTAYLFYSSIEEGRSLLNLLDKTLQNERLKVIDAYKLGEYELSYLITNNYDPNLHLKEADLNNIHYKEVSFSRTSYDNDIAKRVFYAEIAESILNKLLKLKLINCYYLTDGGEEKTYRFFFKKYRCLLSKLVATETYAKLYMLAAQRLIDPISPYWPEFLSNIDNDEKVQSYTMEGQKKLLNQAKKDTRFKSLFI